jgi:tRNA (guanine37-N1)-methyltransferase
VPDVLLSGHLANQLIWKRQQSLIRTLENRPDLLRDAPLTQEDQDFLACYINQKLEESQSTEE